MSSIKIIEKRAFLPLEIPLDSPKYSEVPKSVLELSESIKSWYLIAWNDEISNTVGLAKRHQAIVVNREEMACLSVGYMRPAKGRGWVAFEVQRKDGMARIVLLQTRAYSEEALQWLHTKQKMIELLFGYPLAFTDYGSDY